MIELELPLAPSLNRYYRRVGPRTLISREGRAYRQKVCEILAGLGIKPLDGKLSMDIELFPPTDGRARDLDNFDSKAIFDALQHAGLYHNDNQIKRRSSEWFEPVPGGAMIVRVRRA